MKVSPDPEGLVLNQSIPGPLKPSFLSHQLNALFVEWGSLTRQADCCVLWTNGEGQVEIECTAGVPELALFQLWDLHQFYYCQAKILADFP
jgi:hypothetical protein